MKIIFSDIDLTPESKLPGSPSLNLPVEGKEERVLTRATTDSELAKEYLTYSDLGPASLANTQKELYRFLMWCRHEAGMSIKELMPEDLDSYKSFLKDPPEEWITERKLPRDDPNYRPLSGPLSDESRRQALVTVKAFLTFAALRKYITLNIGALVKNIKKTPGDEERYLSEEEIALAIEAVDARVCKTPKEILRRERDRFLFIAYYYTGARIAELVKADMTSLSIHEGHWRIKIIGKGGKPRELTVHSDLLAAYGRYRAAFGLSPSPSQDEQIPLILSCRGKVLRGITTESAGEAIKAVFLDGITYSVETERPISIRKFELATTHWLRHSMLTHLANHGVQVKTLQEAAGHANLTITSRYIHKSVQDRHIEINAAKDRQNARMKNGK